MNTLFKNATIINEGQQFEASILVKEDRIAQLILDDKYPEADVVIDAKGKYLIPGVIDDQVHFRQPGNEEKATIFSESRAAAAGGVTSFMEMPNTNPATTNMDFLRQKMDIAAKDSLVNYSFYLGASGDNLKDIETLDPIVVAGVKVFMGSSTGNLLVNKRDQLERIFKASPILLTTHCEDDDTIRENLENYKQYYTDSIPIKYHPAIRSAEACYKSSAMAVEIADKCGANLHVLHLSTEREMALFAEGNISDKKITAEVCAHHLWFTEKDYAEKGTLIKWNPAIKSEQDREGLRAALRSGKLDIVATDHAPHLLADKDNIYTKAPSGAPLVQHSLQMMLQMAKQDVITIEEVITKMCHNPAIRYQVKNRGFIRQNYFADLVLVDPNKVHTVNSSNILYKCGWSPMEGTSFDNSVELTMVNGNIVYQNDEIKENIGASMAVEFDR